MRVSVDRSAPQPDTFWSGATTARRRWREPAENLPEKVAYRPGALSAVATALDAEAATAPDHVAVNGAVSSKHTVVSGDTLSKLAKKYYGDAQLYDVIFSANRDVLDHPDEIFVGDVLRIPEMPFRARRL